MLRLKSGWVLTKNGNKAITYLPDFILYDFDETEYQNFWSNIKNHPKGQLYSDGLQIYKVSRLFSLFQSFKGWLGLQNHCQENVVEMALAKVAYAGYLRGFTSKDLVQRDPPLVSQRFINLTGSPRTNQNSSSLQQLLVSYFYTHLAHFPRAFETVPENYIFGQTILNEQLYNLVPYLDPQDNDLINKTIKCMEYYNKPANVAARFPQSTFAEAYAESLFHQGKLQQALAWSEHMSNQYKEAYINFFLQHYSQNKVITQNTVKLIVALALSQKDKAMTYLRNHFTFNAQINYLEPYPELKKILAKTYLSDAIAEKNKYTLMKFIAGSQLIPLLAHAIQLDPQVLDKDSSMQDIMMKEEWMIYQFNEAMKSETRFAEARNIYEKHPSFKYDKKSLLILREQYIKEINEKNKTIASELVVKNIESAEKLALEALELARHASPISTQDDPLIRTTINYASTLLKIDAIKHWDVKEADNAQLNKALGLLEKYASQENNPEFKSVKSSLLERKIENLIEKIKSPTELEHWQEREEWATNHANEIQELQQHLNAYIKLNGQTKSKEVLPTLAKMHFIAGDIFHFFIGNKDQAIVHFAKAAELTPNNPYYQLYYFDLITDEKRHEARETVHQMAHLNEQNYEGWLTERWVTEKILSKGFDIHGVAVEPKSFFSRFWG